MYKLHLKSFDNSNVNSLQDLVHFIPLSKYENEYERQSNESIGRKKSFWFRSPYFSLHRFIPILIFICTEHSYIKPFLSIEFRKTTSDFLSFMCASKQISIVPTIVLLFNIEMTSLIPMRINQRHFIPFSRMDHIIHLTNTKNWLSFDVRLSSNGRKKEEKTWVLCGKKRNNGERPVSATQIERTMLSNSVWSHVWFQVEHLLITSCFRSSHILFSVSLQIYRSQPFTSSRSRMRQKWSMKN